MSETRTLDVTGWKRLPEVEAYAKWRRVTFSQAVIELANAGLSELSEDTLRALLEQFREDNGK